MYDYNEIEFVEPDQDQHIMIAHNKDYIVVLHFSDGIKDLILSEEGLSNLAIQNLFNIHKKTKKNKMEFKDLRGLDLDNGNARATLNIQKKVKALSDVTELFSNVNRDVAMNKKECAQTVIPKRSNKLGFDSLYD